MTRMDMDKTASAENDENVFKIVKHASIQDKEHKQPLWVKNLSKSNQTQGLVN